MPVTDQQKKLLQSCPIMKEHGKEIASKFFSTMFAECPAMRGFFNQTNQKTGRQPLALAHTVYYFAQNLDNLDAMTPQMSRISSKHRAVMVKPEHYPVVGKYLIQAVKDYLGDKATPEMMDAWQALYDSIAETFINREKELYAQLGDDEREHGFVPFVVTKKETIASGPIVAVTLTRQDGGKLFNYHPGQYITIRVEKDGVFHNGHYPLTSLFNGFNYTIAFKAGNEMDQNSVISDEIIRNRLVGSTVLVSPPAGSFALVKDAKHHLFISGGIGITSFIAMVDDLNQKGKASTASLIQCVRNDNSAAFVAKLHKTLAQDQYTILTQEDPLSQNHLEGKIRPDTHIYIAGSEGFLTIAENALSSFNHPKSQVHVRSIETTLRILNSIAKK